MKGLKEIKAEYQVFLNQVPEYLNWVSSHITKSSIVFSLDEVEKVHLHYENNIVNTEEKDYLKQVFIAYIIWVRHL